MDLLKLTALSNSLLKLHKSLLDFQKVVTEKKTGKTMNPYEMLDAALNHPDFRWLKPISQMIVEIDLAHDQEKAGTKPVLESENSPDFDPKKIKMFWENPPQDFQEVLIKAIEHNPDISFFFSEVRLKASEL